MRSCPRCAREAPWEQDFCLCGEYLRWEPTGQTPILDERAAVSPIATPVMTRAVAPTEVTVTLHSEDGEWLPAPRLHVEPGGAVRFTARVRNQRGIVDHFAVQVLGIPPEWWTVDPSTVHLVPYGSDGPCEHEVTVTLAPPRAPEAEARPWDIRVAVFSHAASAREVARVPVVLVIAPFEQLEAELTPRRRARRWRAGFRVRVRNGGNAIARPTIDARDDGERCRFAVRGPALELPPGAVAERTVTVRGRRPIVLGRPVEHAIQMLVGDSLSATFTQRPWLPRWPLLAVPLLALVVAAVLVLPARVPALEGKRVDEAKRLLEEHHLRWHPPERRVSSAPVGTVLETIPAAGATRLRGSEVTLIVATNSKRATVPDVSRATYAEALVKLVKAGFEAQVDPAQIKPDARVVEQIPPAGESWPRGRPVTLILGSGAPKRTNAKAKVPAVAGLPLDEARAKASAAGLEPRVTYEIATEPRGTVLATKPARGALAKGATLELQVSAGFPQLAYDNGRSIFLADGSDGGHGRKLGLNGGGRQTQPSWTPDGAQLVYRSGTADAGRIWIASADRPGAGRPLTGGGHDDRRPAVSPDGTRVAFVRGDGRAEAHRLCLVKLTGATTCLPDVGVGLSRPVWSPDGRTLLVRTDRRRLMRFTAGATSWRQRGVLPLDQLGKVESVAWSERGGLAIAVSPGGGLGATLFHSPDESLRQLRAVPFAGLACEVSWRSDGREIVVAGRRDAKDRTCPETPGAESAATRIAPDGESSAVLDAAMVNPVYRPLEG